MAKEEFVFNVNTLAGCKYPFLKKLLKECTVEKPYRSKLFWTKLASQVTTGVSYIDQLRYNSLSRNLEIEKDPIYILGHWRSGTTLLHNLLCTSQDAVYPTTYQSVFPNNLFFLQGLIKKIVEFYMPEKRLVDQVKLHVDFPQEEDFALGNEAGFSFYYWFYFPKDYRRFTEEYLRLSTEDPSTRTFYKDGYTRFIKRCLLHLDGDQYIAKNPANMARIPFLLDLFPESRFIYIERNPYEVLRSTFKFHRGFLRTLQLQDMDDDLLWEFIFATYKATYSQYQEDKKLIPPSNLLELKYENVIAAPELTLKTLKRGLLSDLKSDDVRLKSVLDEHKNHKANTYAFEQDYVDRVNAELGSLIEIQGYRVLQ